MRVPGGSASGLLYFFDNFKFVLIFKKQKNIGGVTVFFFKYLIFYPPKFFKNWHFFENYTKKNFNQLGPRFF